MHQFPENVWRNSNNASIYIQQQYFQLMLSTNWINPLNAERKIRLHISEGTIMT